MDLKFVFYVNFYMWRQFFKQKRTQKTIDNTQNSLLWEKCAEEIGAQRVTELRNNINRLKKKLQVQRMNKDTKLIWKNIDDLKPYEHNAKEHDEVQVKNIAKSIEKYGWQNPILIDKDNVIIAGHGRVLGAKELGIKDIPCIYADDLTEEQVREYRILDNKLNESEWIDSELEFELPELDLSDFDLDFDIDLDIDEPKEIVEDEVPEVDEQAEPICKLGDIWAIGNHRLICGDSTDPAVIDRLMDGVKADLVFTDPPYGMKKESEGVLINLRRQHRSCGY